MEEVKKNELIVIKTDGETMSVTYGLELEPSDKADLWNWYHNQRGGSCNGS